MGFFDKVKEVGKAAAQSGLTMAATNYGMVIRGKYNHCKVSMSGNDKLVFIKMTNIEGTHVISEDVKTFTLCRSDDSSYLLEIIFNDGESSSVFLKEDNTQNSSLAAKYKTMAFLLSALLERVSDVSFEDEKLAKTIISYAEK